MRRAATAEAGTLPAKALLLRSAYSSAVSLLNVAGRLPDRRLPETSR